MIKINKKTNTATRETLPKFLQGLKPESLYDLSWTDKSLGVQNNAWFNEQDVTVYDSNLVLDGTESFEIDLVNHLVKVTKGQRVKTVEEIEVERLQNLENVKNNFQNTIQNHITEFVKSKGYDNENSIAKYLVEGNPFYIECKALSLWVGNVWLFANNLQNEVIGGVRAMPETNEELVGLLPVYVG